MNERMMNTLIRMWDDFDDSFSLVLYGGGDALSSILVTAAAIVIEFSFVVIMIWLLIF